MKTIILTLVAVTLGFAQDYKPTKEELALDISKVPKSFSKVHQRLFNRYTKITAPNGRPIHFFIQDDLSLEQIIRARNVMRHYLKPLRGSLYGNDKTKVANSMANNGATLLLLNGSDENADIEVEGQPLYKNEIQVEGGKWYVNQDYEHRDATFEEILHLVHDTGIIQSNDYLLLKFQQEIENAQEYALSHHIWGIGEDEWIDELSEEGSLTQEYLASLIDAYYGLWGAWKEDRSSSMWGIYTPRDRDEIKVEDKLGAKLLKNRFFHPYLTYNARIDASFKGTFSLKFDSKIPYTYHSRYLKDITLLGNSNTNVRVNERDNFITGNSGKNSVIFSGKSNQYTIDIKDGITYITDKVKNRDGKNSLKNVEIAKFKDKNVKF